LEKKNDGVMDDKMIHRPVMVTAVQTCVNTRIDRTTNTHQNCPINHD